MQSLWCKFLDISDSRFPLLFSITQSPPAPRVSSLPISDLGYSFHLFDQSLSLSRQARGIGVYVCIGMPRDSRHISIIEYELLIHVTAAIHFLAMSLPPHVHKQPANPVPSQQHTRAQHPRTRTHNIKVSGNRDEGGAVLPATVLKPLSVRGTHIQPVVRMCGD